MGEGDILAVGVGGGAGHGQVEDGRCEIGYRKIIAFRRRIKWLPGAGICDNHAAAKDPVDCNGLLGFEVLDPVFGVGGTGLFFIVGPDQLYFDG